MRPLVLAVLDAYRLLARPWLPAACRFHPSCGDYARDAVASRGVVRGLILAAARVLRCHPFHPGGHDPVPTLSR
ncbi:MAG: membrane protein insertion efficiency factor YidD [Elusimicrobiota bacterium]|nr:MAG: membrane protein insertion efficiency factor YidD [Elusimicrobiota bacterium]